MRTVEGIERSTAVDIQGFRPGGGVPDPYVVLLVDDGHGQVGVMLSPQKANELGEYLRQEAEFAGSTREEGK